MGKSVPSRPKSQQKSHCLCSDFLLKKILFEEVLQLHHKILVQMPLHFLLNFYLDFHILAEKYTSTEQ